MATLESFAGSATVTRDIGNKTIRITGAVCQLGDWITPSAVTISTDRLTVSSAEYAAFTEGDEIIVAQDGGYTGITKNIVYYVVKDDDTNYGIALATTHANAIAATPTKLNISGTGTAGNIRLVLPESNGAILDGPAGVWTPTNAWSTNTFRLSTRKKTAVPTGTPVVVACAGGYSTLERGKVYYAYWHNTQDMGLSLTLADALAATRVTLSGGTPTDVRLVPLGGNAPSKRITPSSVDTTNNRMTLPGGDYSELAEGDPIYISADGGYTGADTRETLYVVKDGSNRIKFATTYASAVAATPTTISLAGSGTASNVRLLAFKGGIDQGYDVVIESSGGLRISDGAFACIGSLEGESVRVLEKSNAAKFGNDNFNSVNCRFGSESWTRLRNVNWRICSSGEGTRTDFDIAQGSGGEGAHIWFESSQVEVDQQYNHLNGKRIVIDGFRYRNFRSDSLTGNQFEMSHALDTAPKGLVIDASDGAFVRWLSGNFTDNVPVEVGGFGGAKVDLYGGNASRILQLNDPDGDIGKQGTGGVVRIHRTQPVNLLGSVSAGTLYFDSQDTGGTDQTKTFAAGATQAGALVRTEFANHGVTSYTDCSSYTVQAVGFGFRKQLLASFDVATSPAAQSMTLVADRFPNGNTPATSSLTSAANLDDVYEMIKTHEVSATGRSSFGKGTPIATIESDGYIHLPDNSVLQLSSTASSAVAVDTTTINSNTRNRVTVKCAATLAVSAKRLNGIKIGGTDGTITLTTVNADAILLSDKSGSSARMTITVNDTGDKAALFKADGTQLGSTFTATATDKDTEIAITVANVGTGAKLVAYRAGYEPQVRTINTSVGGVITETFGPLRQLVQSDGSVNYAASNLTTNADVSFTVTDVAAVDSRINIANAAISAKQCFAEFASACETTNGLKYLAFGGELIQMILLFSGNIIVLPTTCKLKRKASGDASASLLATAIRSDGNIVDSANGSVAVVGGIQLSDFQNAILKDFDLDPNTIGVQSLAGVLLAARTAQTSIKTTVEALPSADDVASTLLAETVESGGDTVKEALARIDNLSTDSAPSAATIVSTLLAESVETNGDTVKQALARLDDIPTDSAPTAATIATTLLAETVETDGDTVKESLARLDDLPTDVAPTAAAIASAILGTDVETDGDTVKEALARLDDIPTGVSPTAEVIAKAVADYRLFDHDKQLVITGAAVGATSFTIAGTDEHYILVGDSFTSGGESHTVTAVNGRAISFTPALTTAIANLDAVVFTRLESLADRMIAVQDDAARLRDATSGLAALKTLIDALPANNASTLLAEEVESSGDTVKESLARLDDIPTDDVPTIQAIANAVSAISVEDEISLRQALQLALAALLGQASVSEDTITFRRLDSSATGAWEVTIGSGGERTGSESA